MTENILEHFESPVIIYGLIGFFIVSVFVIVLTYDLTKKAVLKFHRKPGEAADDNTSIDLLILIYVDIFLMLIYMIFLLFRFIVPFYKNQCKLIGTISLTLFQLTRTIIFIIFVRRIQVVYCDTIFAFKKKYIYILYLCIGIYSIPYICYFNWSHILIQPHHSKQFHCSVTYKPDMLFFIISVLDILISITCLYLFIYPLNKLIAHQDDDSTKNQLFNIIIKLCTLYCVSIFSSIILSAVSFIFPFGFYYGIIDGLINGTMLILLDPMHNVFYKHLCCALHKCCMKCCNTKSKKAIQKNVRLKLAPISVLENIPSTTNNDTKQIKTPQMQTPINVLLTQNMSKMYQKAAKNEPAFSQKVEMASTQTQTPKPAFSGNRVKSINEWVSETQTISIKDPIVNIVSPSSQSPDCDTLRMSNTLQFIRNASNHL